MKLDTRAARREAAGQAFDHALERAALLQTRSAVLEVARAEQAYRATAYVEGAALAIQADAKNPDSFED
jgi:CRISPR/Cas system-associated exonuclease Cas4 (RecB family)